MSEELKPCPFCGGEANVIDHHNDDGSVSVGCNNDTCLGFSGLGWLYKTEAEAIAAWNTRTPEQAIAVTLGSDKPPYDELLRCLKNDWHINASWDGLRKFWCIELTEEGVKLRDAAHGTLTAEQVREAIFNGSSYASYDGAQYYANGINMQAIADELNTAMDRPTFDANLEQALSFMRIWISEDAHLGESAISYELEKAEGLRKLDAIESAIAATLGRSTLTAHDVWEAIGNHGVSQLQAIADALAAMRRGECELVYGETDGGVDSWFTQCGGRFAATFEDGRMVHPKFCQLCGSKAVKR